jgi:hypothetical protein
MNPRILGSERCLAAPTITPSSFRTTREAPAVACLTSRLPVSAPGVGSAALGAADSGVGSDLASTTGAGDASDRFSITGTAGRSVMREAMPPGRRREPLGNSIRVPTAGLGLVSAGSESAGGAAGGGVAGRAATGSDCMPAPPPPGLAAACGAATRRWATEAGASRRRGCVSADAGLRDSGALAAGRALGSGRSGAERGPAPVRSPPLEGRFCELRLRAAAAAAAAACSSSSRRAAAASSASRSARRRRTSAPLRRMTPPPPPPPPFLSPLRRRAGALDWGADVATFAAEPPPTTALTRFASSWVSVLM